MIETIFATILFDSNCSLDACQMSIESGGLVEQLIADLVCWQADLVHARNSAPVTILAFPLNDRNSFGSIEEHCSISSFCKDAMVKLYSLVTKECSAGMELVDISAISKVQEARCHYSHLPGTKIRMYKAASCTLGGRM
jgi:hypothetical protein